MYFNEEEVKEDESKQIENKNPDDIEFISEKKVVDVKESSETKGSVEGDEKNTNETKNNDDEIELVSEKKVVDVRGSAIIREQLHVGNCLEVKNSVFEGLDLTLPDYQDRLSPRTPPGTERQLTTMVIKFIFDH